MSIKMICSDLDGTLLTYTQTELSDRLFSEIRELRKRGIWFVPASGRQITSIQRLFEPVKDCCYFICSNGTVICDGDGNVIAKQAMPREVALAIAHDFLERSDGRGEVNLAGVKTCHLISKGLGMVERLNFIGNHIKMIDSPEQVEEDIVKVSVFLPDGAEHYIDRFGAKWKEYQPAIAGPYWIDTTLASKGSGVELLSKHLKLTLDQVMAFGDNYNDVTMLDIVGKPYIMSTAAEELLKRYPNHTSCVEDTIEMFLTCTNS